MDNRELCKLGAHGVETHVDDDVTEIAQEHGMPGALLADGFDVVDVDQHPTYVEEARDDGGADPLLTSDQPLYEDVGRAHGLAISLANSPATASRSFDMVNHRTAWASASRARWRSLLFSWSSSVTRASWALRSLARPE